MKSRRRKLRFSRLCGALRSVRPSLGQYVMAILSVSFAMSVLVLRLGFSLWELLAVGSIAGPMALAIVILGIGLVWHRS